MATSVIKSDLQEKQLDFEEGDRLCFQSRYTDAFKAYETILECISISSKDSSPELASLYYKLGICSFKMAKFSDAHTFLEKALNITKLIGDNILEVARILYTIGDTYIEEAKYPEAEEKCKEALRLVKENFGEGHRELIACYNKFARLSEAREDYEEEQKHLEIAFRIGSMLNIELDAELATSYFRSSNAYWYEGENEKAKECVEKSLSMRQKIYGEKHLDVAMCYKNLGRIAHDKNELSQALDYHNKGLNIVLECVGNVHLDLADFYCNIGRVQVELKEYDKSLENYEKALEIERKILPPDHPNLAHSYADFAETYKQQERFEEALEEYNKALKQFAGKFGENHWRTAVFYGNIAEVYSKQEEYSQARKLVKKQLEIQKKCFGTEDQRLVEVYNDLAFLYFQDNKYKRVLQNYLKATKINSLLLKERLAEAVFNIYNMSYIFEYVGDTSSQESLAKKSLVACEKLYGRYNDSTQDSINALEFTQRRKCLEDHNNNYTF